MPVAVETHNANVEVAASVERALKKLNAEEHDFVKFRAVAAIIKKPGRVGNGLFFLRGAGF